MKEMSSIITNTRRQEVIKLLRASLNSAPLTVEKIARILGVSNRTVRYDLESIEDEIKKRGYILCKKAQKGVWLEPLSAQNESGAACNHSEYYEYVLSKKERRNAILAAILGAQDAIAAERLAERLGISRSTLLSDLKEVKETLKKSGLSLSSKRGLGLWIEGGETMRRKLLIDIFSQCLHDFGETELRGAKTSYEAVCFQTYTNGLPVKEIADYFIELAGRRRLSCYDYSINYMIVALAVQLKRLNDGKRLSAAEEQGPEGNDAALGALAKEIARFLGTYNPRFYDAPEIRFIGEQLLSSKIYMVSEKTSRADESESINLMSLTIAKTFVEHCQIWLGDIYMDDEELLYNLALHLQPAVKRAKYGIELTNPLLPQIRQQYENLFMIAYKAAKIIEQKLEIKISEDEIGYLAIHLGAAIERKKFRKSRKLQVVLVCGNGVGTANLLAMTLKNRLANLNIVDVVSSYELGRVNLQGIDMVISTIALKLENIAVLHISPILSDEEIKVIESQIQFFCNKNFSMQEKSREKPRGNLTLADVLLPETVALDVEAADWEEAIARAGVMLVATGGAEARYVSAMIDCVKKIGPYIVIGPGLAMPHARPEDGVNRICLSMARLKTPVNFGSAHNDPIDMVFAFGAVDANSHLTALYELWRIFHSEQAMSALRSVGEKERALALIRRFSQAGKTEGA